MGKKTDLIGLKASVKTALAAASIFLGSTQKRAVESFLQAPFTGTYTSQSAEIVGILKNMRDTFKANLANAIMAEKTQKASFGKFMKTKKAAHENMKESYDKKEENL